MFTKKQTQNAKSKSKKRSKCKQGIKKQKTNEYRLGTNKQNPESGIKTRETKQNSGKETKVAGISQVNGELGGERQRERRQVGRGRSVLGVRVLGEARR